MTKRIIALIAIVGCVALIIVIGLNPLWAVQESGLRNNTAPTVPTILGTVPPDHVMPGQNQQARSPLMPPAAQGLVVYPPNRIGPAGSFDRKIIRKIKDAESDEGRQKAIDDAREQLGKAYDSFLESKEKQIEQLEKRLTELREHLDKRRDAKDRLVDLKLELIISQADGIGWPGNDFDWFNGLNVRPLQPNAPNPFGEGWQYFDFSQGNNNLLKSQRPKNGNQ